MSARNTRVRRAPARRRAGLRARLLVGLATVVGLALGGAVAPIATTPASAAEISGAITSVAIVETSIADAREPMRLNVAFSIGAGIGRGGTAQGGDTFWLDLDPRLRATNDTFNVFEVGSSTNVVATVRIVGGSRATFTLTDYVNDRSFTDGAVFWAVSFRTNTTPAGAYDLEFTSLGATFPDSVTVRSTYVPSPGNVNPPLISGRWIDGSNEQRGTWRAILPDTADTLVFESFGWTSGPLWEFDCRRTLANINSYRNYFNPVVEISIECRTDYLRWELANVPDYSSAGLHPVLSVDFDVTDPSQSGDLVFRIPTTYTINGGTPRPLTGEIRQTRGGQALGPTTPDAPTWVSSICVAGAPTDPTVTLPPNGNGVTYSQNIDDPRPGDTVEVIAELSTDFEWDLPLAPEWEILSESVAVFRIQLDDAPDCSVSPADPTITQTSCAAGAVVEPVIALPADDAVITYSTDPVDYGAGDTVRIVATLVDTDYTWDTVLPAGWTAESATVAARTVVLDDAIDCRLVAVPSAPSVTQAVCSAGVQSDPDVTPPADTGAITYRIDGDVEAGETVDVVATLTGPQYRWATSLPTGWVAQSATVARFAVTLDDPTCVTAVTPTSPTVTQAICAAGDSGQPRVAPAAATTAIRYAVDGQVRPGATVDVVATLTGPEYVWSTPLPAEWDETSPTTASFRVALDLPICSGGGDGGGLAATGRDTTALGLGGALVLLLGGVILAAARIRSRRARA